MLGFRQCLRLGNGGGFGFAQYADQVELARQFLGDVSMAKTIAGQEHGAERSRHAACPYQLLEGVLLNNSSKLNFAALPPGTSLVSKRARCTGSLNSRFAARSIVNPKS